MGVILMLRCEFPILLVEAYCRNSTKAKIKIFPLGQEEYPVVQGKYPGIFLKDNCTGVALNSNPLGY
jgi:hypothetical protein